MTRPTLSSRPVTCGLRLKPVALALACMGVSSAWPQTIPTQPTLRAGSAAVGSPTDLNNGGGMALGISQSSNRAVFDWQTFSIGAKDQVNISQPSTSSVLLNRVTGAQSSVIAGRLVTTLVGNPAAVGGSVYLINPNGVLFSNGSSVSVGGLVASTLDIAGPDDTTRNAAFMAGGVINPATSLAELSFNGSSLNGVTVASGASITVGPGGTVGLMGAAVRNAGTIQAPRGSVNLASASGVTLVIDPVGDGLTTLRITDPSTVSALVENTGSITADGGRVALQAASTAAETVVRQSGVLRARSIETRGGEVVLDASAGGAENVLSIEGGQIDVSGGALAGGTVTATAPLLRFSAGSVDASGSRGGMVTLNGGVALAMASNASVAANGSTAQGGIVNLGATTGAGGGFAHVAGSIDARGATNGGQVITGGKTIEIGRTASIDASGGTGANGQWLVQSSQDLVVTANQSSRDPVYQSDGFTNANNNSAVADAVLGGALGRSTDVVISSSASGPFPAMGILFESGAQVQKNQGRESTLTVNSDRSIAMASGSEISALGEAGPLNVNLNADASGPALEPVVPMTNISNTGQRMGYIELESATIATGGGNIRFYGQSDAANGRAIGGYSTSGLGVLDGITVNGSTLTTCAGEACAGAGAIHLRGQGGTVDGSSIGNPIIAGAGVLILDSKLSSGGGAISLDGQGGLAATGVGVRGFTREVDGQASSIESVSGDILLTGRSRNWVTGDPINIYSGDLGAGVSVDSSVVGTGGNVTITGIGADVSLLQAEPGFVDAVLGMTEGGAFFPASNGVSLSFSSVSAGKGKTIDVKGTAGSDAFEVNSDGVFLGDVSSSAVQVRGYGSGLQTEGGQVRIDGGTGDVRLEQLSLLVELEIPLTLGFAPLVSTANADGRGGDISVTGRNIGIDGAVLDSSGATGGGNIDVRASALPNVEASGIVALNSSTSLMANATDGGDGGRITVVGENTLRAYGMLQARGGPVAGNGGHIETSGGAIDLAGLVVDASAPSGAGAAGQWLIDPYDIAIESGSGVGSLPLNPFTPLDATVLQDGDINNALNAGTNVTITTGTGGSPSDGTITFGSNVNINYSAAAGPVMLQLDAHRSIRSVDNTAVIESSGSGGPLNVVFNADVNNSGPTVGGGQIDYRGNIVTNGGTVTMNANLSDPSSSFGAIYLTGLIDTRVGQSDASLASGDVVLNGQVTSPVGNRFVSQPGVWLSGATITTASGNVTVNGTSNGGDGVRIEGGDLDQGIFTTSGNVSVTGLATDPFIGISGSGFGLPSQGVLVSGASVDTGAGHITLRGHTTDVSEAGSAGLRVTNGAQISTTGGDIELTGSAVADGAGLSLLADLPDSNLSVPASVQGGGNVLLRADNNGSGDAVVIDVPVSAFADGVLNLRPGAVDATGGVADRVNTPITIGSTANTAAGFDVSSAEFGRLFGGALVFGSGVHAADITVAGNIASPNDLTLQNGAGGNIQLNGTVSAAKLGLLSAGNIAQGGAGAITASELLARSSGASVNLQNGTNDVGTVGGGAAGAFSYVDANAVTLGPVSVTGFDATGTLLKDITPMPLKGVVADSLAANTVFVRTLSQDLTLGASVSAATTVDLVAGATFQNPGGYSISAASWRVWADAWMGETRGGLIGSGALPNLYNCAYMGLCTVVVPSTDNHFIYAQQPKATVVIADASRPFGLSNPTFLFSVTGLILGDTASSFTGQTGTSAVSNSPPGSYAITGTFNSAAGYAIDVIPGVLTVSDVTTFLSKLPLPPVFNDTSNVYTYTFDRNIGLPPICLAADAAGGSRASQGEDMLAREWSRVRARPNLTSCVSTDKRNGCSDF